MASPDTSTASLSELEQALLELQATPARLLPGLREPARLFAAIDDIIAIAVGRAGTEQPVQDAATAFIRRALLHAGANHYQLLGLEGGADAADIKKRYRLLMRLLHPDFAAQHTDWAADAAVRVNLAYETLSSPERRREYDRQLEQPPRLQPGAGTGPGARRTRRAPKPARHRSWGVRVAIAGSFAVAMLLMVLLVVTNEPLPDELVQRAPAARPAMMQSALDAVVQAAQQLSDSVSAAPAPTQAAQADEVAAATPAASAPAAAASPLVLAQAEPAAAAGSAAAPASVPAAPAPSPAPTASGVAAQAASATPAPAAAPTATPAAAPPQPAPLPPGLTVADAHPVLARLLLQVETGKGEELLALLERGARGSPEAQALARAFDDLVQGARPRITNVQFRGEAREGRLLVRGSIKLAMDGAGQAARDFDLQAEFAQRDGSIVLTRLAPGS